MGTRSASRLTAPYEPALHDLIKIIWLDSFVWNDSPWISKNDIPEDRSTIESVGYFIRQSDRFLVYAQSMCKDEYGGVFYIPNGCILNIEQLQ